MNTNYHEMGDNWKKIISMIIDTPENSIFLLVGKKCYDVLDHFKQAEYTHNCIMINYILQNIDGIIDNLIMLHNTHRMSTDKFMKICDAIREFKNQNGIENAKVDYVHH